MDSVRQLTGTIEATQEADIVVHTGPGNSECDLGRLHMMLERLYPDQSITVGIGDRFVIKMREYDSHVSTPAIRAAIRRACLPEHKNPNLEVEPKDRAPLPIGQTPEGEMVFVPVAGPRASQFVQFRGEVVVCSGCRCTMRIRGPGAVKHVIIDDNGAVYHLSCAQRVRQWAIEVAKSAADVQLTLPWKSRAEDPKDGTEIPRLDREARKS